VNLISAMNGMSAFGFRAKLAAAQICGGSGWLKDDDGIAGTLNVVEVE